MSIADLLARQGEVIAQGQRESGRIWGGLAKDLGEIPTRTYGQVLQARSMDRQDKLAESEIALRQTQMTGLQAQQAEQQRQQAGRQVLAKTIGQHTTTDPQTQAVSIDHRAVASDLSTAGFPDQAESWLKMAAGNAEALQKLEDSKRTHLGAQMDTAVEIARQATSADDFTAGIGLAAAHGLIDAPTASQLLAAADAAGPDGWRTILARVQALSPKAQAEGAKTREEQAKPLVVHPGGAVVIPGTGQSIAGPLDPSKQPIDAEALRRQVDALLPKSDPKLAALRQTTIGRLTGIQTRQEADKVIEDAVSERRALIGIQTGNAQVDQENAKKVAQGYADGTISIDHLQATRQTSIGTAVLAELHDMGFNEAKAMSEWIGTKAAIRSLNGSQQIQLAQALTKASSSLDRLDALNAQWGTLGARLGLKALGHVELKAAQNGSHGAEAQSVAQLLEGQIADVTAEIGQALMKGNSPTDKGLELAAKNLSADWTQKMLTDAIRQVRYNLNLAQHARNDMLQQLGVQGTQFQNLPAGASGAGPAITAKEPVADRQTTSTPAASPRATAAPSRPAPASPPPPSSPALAPLPAGQMRIRNRTTGETAIGPSTLPVPSGWERVP